MSVQQYHYIGDAEGQTQSGEGVQIGATFSGTVRTRLLACGKCGAAVPEGHGRSTHDIWHENLREAIPAPRGAWKQL